MMGAASRRHLNRVAITGRRLSSDVGDSASSWYKRHGARLGDGKVERIPVNDGTEYVDEEVLGRPRVEFCARALQQTKARGITKREVVAAIKFPDVVGLNAPRGRDRVRKIKKPNKAIDVVFQLRVDTILVITAFPKEFSRRRMGWRTNSDSTSPSTKQPAKRWPCSSRSAKEKRRRYENSPTAMPLRTILAAAHSWESN